MPNREISIVREITKMYEECINGTIEEVCSQIENTPIKGEIVLVIAPFTEKTTFEDIDIEKILIEELKESTLKDAVKKVSDTYKLKKSDVYEKALKIKNNTL